VTIHDLKFPLYCLAALGVVLLILATLYHSFRERREQQSIKEMFARYVPDQVIRTLTSNPGMLRLGGQRCRLTILFADLNGFTALCEKIPPEELVDQLNEYMTAMTEIIHMCGGIIDKYEGDLIMAEFGAPVFYPDHSLHACRAALRMQERLDVLRREWAGQGKPPFFLRIGVNTGEGIVGNMGSKTLFDYTVLGDAVNLCARLEEANKQFGTEIIISETTFLELPEDFVTRPLGELQVRGRSESVTVYELLAESDREWRQRHSPELSECEL
jgi:adenylate cyclase